MEINDFLQHFNHTTQAGSSQWRANCPACNDTKQHLYISRAPNGTILLDCKRGCSFNDIVFAANLKAADCFAENPVKAPRWELLREHYYTSIDGKIIAKKQIYDTGKGKKTGIWYRLKNGQYTKGLDGQKMPLYHLDRLVKSNETVVIAEGEKDVETVERMGFISTTSPNGAGSKWRQDFNEFFRGRNVVILCDNDEVGGKYGRSIAEELIKTATSVKLIPAKNIYPNVKEKGDISDIAAALGESKAKELLTDAIKKALPFTSEAQTIITATEPLITPQETAKLTISETLNKIKPQLKYAYNDRGNGELFSAIYGDVARYNITAKEWYIFKDGYWQEDTGAMQVSNYAKELYDALLLYASSLPDESKSNYISHVNKMGRLNVRDTMIKDARDRNYIKSEDFDKNIWLFNCRNGTYDLKNGYFRKHRPNDLLSKMSNVTYDENAQSPEFERFLKDIMSCDGEKMQFLITALGYALTGDVSQECMFILYGSTTRNGKGTLMETISYMMGGERGYAMAATPETLARRQNKDSRQASGDIARLRGARFLNVSEPDKSMVFDTALIKTLTGRDTITARHLHEREIQFVPNFKLFINTNYLPHVTDDTVFSSERINVISFDRHFSPEEQDKGLKDRLKTEENISGIFNICLKGLREYLQNGLVRPLTVSAATEEYRRLSDRQGMFISECLEADINSNVKAKDVYETYLNWCRDNNFRAENKSNFMAGLRNKGLLREYKKVNGYVYRNIITGYKFADGYDYSIDDENNWEDVPL